MNKLLIGLAVVAIIVMANQKPKKTNSVIYVNPGEVAEDDPTVDPRTSDMGDGVL